MSKTVTELNSWHCAMLLLLRFRSSHLLLSLVRLEFLRRYLAQEHEIQLLKRSPFGFRESEKAPDHTRHRGPEEDKRLSDGHGVSIRTLCME